MWRWCKLYNKRKTITGHRIPFVINLLCSRNKDPFNVTQFFMESCLQNLQTSMRKQLLFVTMHSTFGSCILLLVVVFTLIITLSSLALWHTHTLPHRILYLKRIRKSWVDDIFTTKRGLICLLLCLLLLSGAPLSLKTWNFKSSRHFKCPFWRRFPQHRLFWTRNFSYWLNEI